MESNTNIAVLKFTPAIFDPNKEQLRAIAVEVAQITADPALMMKEDFELVNTTKNKLVKARTSIQKAGKAAREAATAYNRDVIAYEKELIAIIEPEEERLRTIETAAKEFAMRKVREETLPEFKAVLASIGDTTVFIDDESLLRLDPNGRIEYYNGRLSRHLEDQRAVDDTRRAEENAKLNAEREVLEREKKAITDEAQRQADLKAAAEKAATEATAEAERKVAAEAAENKRKEDAAAAEGLARTRSEGYAAWLAACSFNQKTDMVAHNDTDGTTGLYRCISVYTHHQTSSLTN